MFFGEFLRIACNRLIDCTGFDAKCLGYRPIQYDILAANPDDSR